MTAFRPGQSPPPVRTPTFVAMLSNFAGGYASWSTYPAKEARRGDSMPKAGIEPARGLAPLDFESSASPSSATSAGFIAGTAYRQGLAAWTGRRHNCGPESSGPARRELAAKHRPG